MTDKISAIHATMSLSQNVRLLSRRPSSTLAAMASWLVGTFVDTMISRSTSLSERAYAACSSGVISEAN